MELNRAAIAGGSRIGPPDAPVTILEFGGYECPFCRDFSRVIEALLSEHADEVAFVFRHLPFEHQAHGYRAARFAECAAEQDRFQEAHGLLNRLNDFGDLDPTRFGQEAGVGDQYS